MVSSQGYGRGARDILAGPEEEKHSTHKKQRIMEKAYEKLLFKMEKKTKRIVRKNKKLIINIADIMMDKGFITNDDVLSIINNKVSREVKGKIKSIKTLLRNVCKME